MCKGSSEGRTHSLTLEIRRITFEMDERPEHHENPLLNLKSLLEMLDLVTTKSSDQEEMTFQMIMSVGCMVSFEMTLPFEIHKMLS